MKKYLALISLIGFLFGQDSYRLLLESDESLKSVGENYEVIKTELDKMLSDYKSKVDLSEFHKVKYTETIYTGPVKRDLDAINAELEEYMRNGLRGVPYSQWTINEKKLISDRVEAKHTYRPSKTVHKTKNRIINYQKLIETREAEWSDLVSFHGGYSKLVESNITKSDLYRFQAKIKVEKIELTGPSTCLAHVKIEGNPNALKFHKIPKSYFKYVGSYDIKYIRNYLTLYDGGTISIGLKFNKNTYLPSFEEVIELDENSLLPPFKKYRDGITLMFQDLVSEEVISNLKAKITTDSKIKKVFSYLKLTEKEIKNLSFFEREKLKFLGEYHMSGVVRIGVHKQGLNEIPLVKDRLYEPLKGNIVNTNYMSDDISTPNQLLKHPEVEILFSNAEYFINHSKNFDRKINDLDKIKNYLIDGDISNALDLSKGITYNYRDGDLDNAMIKTLTKVLDRRKVKFIDFEVKIDFKVDNIRGKKKRKWTVNGQKVRGTLFDIKDDDYIVILSKKKEIKVDFNDLSKKDINYLLPVTLGKKRVISIAPAWLTNDFRKKYSYCGLY